MPTPERAESDERVVGHAESPEAWTDSWRRRSTRKQRRRRKGDEKSRTIARGRKTERNL